MHAVIFQVDEADEGGFTARALGHSIFTEAESLDELRVNVRDAVHCHFDEGEGPGMMRLHCVRDEVLEACACRAHCTATVAVERGLTTAYPFHMSAVIDNLMEQALALPSDARTRLVERLLASLDPVPDADIQAQWTTEAIRRRDEIRSGAVKPVSRDEARARIGRIIP